MFRQIAIPLAALAVSAMAPAHADQEFKVSFDQPAGASAQEVYVSFKQTAHQACEADLRRAGRVTLKNAMTQRTQCNAELLTKAVAAVGDAQLAAIHRSATGETSNQLLAQAK